MRSNPKEIIIILIRSDTNYLGEDGNPVNLSIQDALLQSTLLDSNGNSLLNPIPRNGGCQIWKHLLNRKKHRTSLIQKSICVKTQRILSTGFLYVELGPERKDNCYYYTDFLERHRLNLELELLLHFKLYPLFMKGVLLDRSHLFKPIRKYGGIFIGGETNLATINILDGWPVTQSATPQTVIQAINKYYFKEEYIEQIKQTSGEYDLIMSKRKLKFYMRRNNSFNFIVTATSQTVYTSIIYEATVSQGLNVEPDLVKRALLDPGNLLAVAPLTNQLMINDIQKHCILFELLQAVIIDDFNQGTANALINFNIKRIDYDSSTCSSDSD